MKYKVGDKVYVLYKYAPNGLIEGTIQEVYTKARVNVTIEHYYLIMSNYYQHGNYNESHSVNPEFIRLESHFCTCTEDFLVPFGEAGKVLYGV